MTHTTIGLPGCLGDPAIQELVRQNPTRYVNFVRAATILNGKPNATAALCKSAEAFLNGKVKVFISYKKHEFETATRTVDILKNVTEEMDISFAGDWSFGVK